jgi:hypothetical protein
VVWLRVDTFVDPIRKERWFLRVGARRLYLQHGVEQSYMGVSRYFTCL